MKRKFGVLMPIASLPSSMGIGSIGEPAYRFINWLKDAGQDYWQILPVTHADGASPYMGFSAFAGNPLLIDLNLLRDEGLIKDVPVPNEPGGATRVNYEWVEKHHMPSLREAYQNVTEKMQEKIDAFASENEWWLSDYAFFMAYRDHLNHKPIWEFEKRVKVKEKKAIQLYKELLAEEIGFYKFIQYVFFEQWFQLKKYANDRGIELIGDMPIYVSPNSADVWSNPKLFKVDEELKATRIAGCPPDAYAKEGQLWGNPVYDWEYHRKTGYKWWISRIKHSLKMVDVLRIDHFRGFDRYWEVNQGEENAINGKWIDGPKMRLFEAINNQIPGARIIAEDLGTIDDGVRDLLKKTSYPGMKVMIFGLTEDNEHSPQNWPKHVIGYTSTHDSEPIRAAIESLSKEQYRKVAKSLKINTQAESIGVIKAAYDTKAETVIVPMPDVLSCGWEARINTPGKVGPENWSWRPKEELFSTTIADKMASLVAIYK